MGGLTEIAAGLKLVVFDVDGVFTDGRIWLGSDGTEFKAFSVRDGVGVKALLSAGLEVAIISGRSSPAVDRRMAELGVRHVVQGCNDKAPALRQIIERLGLEPSQVAYLGELSERCGIGIVFHQQVEPVDPGFHGTLGRDDRQHEGCGAILHDDDPGFANLLAQLCGDECRRE